MPRQYVGHTPASAGAVAAICNYNSYRPAGGVVDSNGILLCDGDRLLGDQSLRSNRIQPVLWKRRRLHIWSIGTLLSGSSLLIARKPLTRIDRIRSPIRPCLLRSQAGRGQDDIRSEFS